MANKGIIEKHQTSLANQVMFFICCRRVTGGCAMPDRGMPCSWGLGQMTTNQNKSEMSVRKCGA